ncbi:MAG: hypothetical protein K2P20_06630 [Oscillospiraceae bacterium]|nr:hypothetical protein [Oscillospiraceae bacterium]
MKQYFQRNKILLALTAAALLVSAAVIAGRWRVEADNKTCDIILDYSELALLAEQSEHDVRWWLEQFRDMGITQVGLTEESLDSLTSDRTSSVRAVMMDQVLADPSWRENYPAAVGEALDRAGYDRFDVLAEVRNGPEADFLLRAAEDRLPQSLRISAGDKTYLLVDGAVGDLLYRTPYNYVNTKSQNFTTRRDVESSKLMFVSLGLLPEKVALLQELGMDIVPRTISYNGLNGRRYAQAVLDGYEALGIHPDYIIAGGEALIGYDDEEERFALEYLRDNDIAIGLIETNVQRQNIMQDGVEEAAAATDYNAVRVFSVWDYIQFRYAYYGYEGAEEIENTLYRAVVERNIRAIYFKPIKDTNNYYTYITDIEVYRELFDSLSRRLSAHGISMGQASVMENYQIPRLALLAIGLGAAFGGLLLLDAFLPVRRRWRLPLALAAAVCVAGAWFAAPNTYRLVASFAGAVVFASLAAAFFLRRAKLVGEKLPADAPLRCILPKAMGILALAAALALGGAMMTAAPLSSTDYMLELHIFRGVKAAQLLPLAVFCVLFLSYYGFFEKDRRVNSLQVRDLLDDVVALLRWTIPVWAVLAAGVIGCAGYYYIARTGHETTVTVTTVEVLFRNYLENLLLARPRTKEFLVAFPCIMLAVHCAVRRLPLFTALFGLAGTIGLTSVCNTFMHIRTPLYLGFTRTACSLALGLLLGVVYTACFELLYRLWLRLRKKFAETERK